MNIVAVLKNQKFQRAERVFLILFLFSSSHLIAQKIERETRIKEDSVPSEALSYINTQSLRRVKWYQEQGFNSSSIEAKFKSNKRSFSVEFDEKGNLEDIEIEFKIDELKSEVKGAIINALEHEFSKFKVQKLQIQHKNASLNQLLNTPLPGWTFEHRLEIVVKGKKTKLPQLWELTFDKIGQLLSIQEIVPRNSVHLEY